MAKHMRLPNGFGQISKLNQRLRNPYRAMVTIDWTNEGKPIRKIVGYYKTYNEAYKALVEYHSDPMACKPDMTMIELYEKWLEEYSKKTPRAEYNYRAAWKYGEVLYRYQVKDVRSYHIKQAVEGEMPPSMHQRLHNLLNLMFDFAVEYELTDSNYSRLSNPIYDSVSNKESIHFAFTEEEISTLWANRSKYEVIDLVLTQIYMGWRPQEILNINTTDVDLNEWTIVGGLKTEAGRGRIVPIHERLKPVIEAHMDHEGRLFKNIKNHGMLNDSLKVMVQELGLTPGHLPHNGRVTFATLCKKYKVDEYARKVFMGHAVKDITDRVYTDLDMDWFRNEINKIESTENIQ